MAQRKPGHSGMKLTSTGLPERLPPEKLEAIVKAMHTTPGLAETALQIWESSSFDSEKMHEPTDEQLATILLGRSMIKRGS